MFLNSSITGFLKRQGADFVYVTSVSHLPEKQGQGFPYAILFGVVLSRDYLQKVSTDSNYIEELKKENRLEKDEFHGAEIKTDEMADALASYLRERGYLAFSQSEKNLMATGLYHEKTKSTPLPHKTIACMAGLGWIGKHNLLVTDFAGSAISMCSLLTDAPLETTTVKAAGPECGSCRVCREVCPVQAIKGKSWRPGIHRDELIDVYHCTTCLKCLVHCPWTQKYMKGFIV